MICFSRTMKPLRKQPEDLSHFAGVVEAVVVTRITVPPRLSRLCPSPAQHPGPEPLSGCLPGLYQDTALCLAPAPGVKLHIRLRREQLGILCSVRISGALQSAFPCVSFKSLVSRLVLKMAIKYFIDLNVRPSGLSYRRK